MMQAAAQHVIPAQAGTQDHRIIVEFFVDAVQLGHRSEVEGRPVFEDREFVRILIAGDAKTEVVKAVTPEVRQKYAQAYEHWKRTQQPLHDGTPLKEWPALRPAQVRELNALNLFTVEHLAGLDDAGIGRIGLGGRELAAKAKAYLSQSASQAAAQQYAAENERLKGDIAALTRQVREIGAQCEALKALKERADG